MPEFTGQEIRNTPDDSGHRGPAGQIYDILCSDVKIPRRLSLKALLGITTAGCATLGIGKFINGAPLRRLDAAYGELYIASRLTKSENFTRLTEAEHYSSDLLRNVATDVKILKACIENYTETADYFIDDHRKPGVIKQLFGQNTSQEVFLAAVTIPYIKLNPESYIRKELKTLINSFGDMPKEFSLNNAMFVLSECRNAEISAKAFLTTANSILQCSDMA